MNTDEIRSLGALQVIDREAMSDDKPLLYETLRECVYAGALLGGMLGAIATVWACFLQGRLKVAIAVGTSLVAISLLASISGLALPFLFRYLRLDPALISSPFITTAVDVIGVLIYFSLARVILKL